MSKIIIFCGVDRTGKSTIAKALNQITGIPYFKNPKERQIFTDSNLQALYFTAPVILEFCKQTPYSFIFDRGYPCEYAYSLALNRKTDTEQIMKLDEEYSKMNTNIIYCYKSINNESYENELITKSQSLKIHERYLEFLSKTKCKNTSIDTSDKNLQNQLIYILYFLNMFDYPC